MTQVPENNVDGAAAAANIGPNNDDGRTMEPDAEHHAALAQPQCGGRNVAVASTVEQQVQSAGVVDRTKLSPWLTAAPVLG